MKVATNEEHIIKEILSEPGLNELTSKKIQVPRRKVMVCFGNNIASFLVNNKCFRSGLRCIFVSHWVNEFFNTVVYYRGENRNRLYFMTLQCACNLAQGVSIFTPALTFYETLFTVILPWKISTEWL